MTIVSLWNFECSAKTLTGCGIDAERIERFEEWADPDSEKPPFIFSEEELAAVQGKSDPTLYLCVCFCAKEALFKALGFAYNYAECTAAFNTLQEPFALRIPGEIASRQSIRQVIAHAFIDKNECIVTVHLLGRG